MITLGIPGNKTRMNVTFHMVDILLRRQLLQSNSILNFAKTWEGDLFLFVSFLVNLENGDIAVGI